SRMTADAGVLLAAYRGRPHDATALFAAAQRESNERGDGFGLQLIAWAGTLLNIGLARYAEALADAEEATNEAWQSFNLTTPRILPELVEAAVRAGEPAKARQALDRLLATTDIADSDWAAGIAARTTALLSTGKVAEDAYVEAIERLSRTQLRIDL